jgi:hypothetical protein
MKTPLALSCAILLLFSAVLPGGRLAAHCDALDGPVIESARAALDKGDVTPVLKWVTQDGEKEIRDAFALTSKVRAQGGDARKVADTHFFETLVRVHRAGEGEPFTGLKPAGRIDPAFAAADKALREGSVDEVAGEIAKSVQEGLHKRFATVMEKKKHAEDNIAAGRAFVAAYVEYAHFVEALHAMTSKEDGEHQKLHSVHGHE